MNTFHSSQPAGGKYFGYFLGALALMLGAVSAHADFSGPFSLTPPAPGVYGNPVNASVFGGWTLTTPGGDIWQVDTGTAPTNLTLSVIDFVGGVPGPTALTFTTALLPFGGTIQFDFLTAYGFNAPQISFQLNGVDLAGYINPASGSASIPVLAGDTLGFRLSAITDGVVASQATLRVFNVVPEPTTSLLAVAGFALLGLGLRKRRG